ncbi:MAG: hypothetical protein NT013_25300, partial [Planctomycetia bacterium]|nr:hypothetical protein [Planctomycetia bacterium]
MLSFFRSRGYFESLWTSLKTSSLRKRSKRRHVSHLTFGGRTPETAEYLEDRCLPAFGVAFSAGVLTLTGTAAADNVEVTAGVSSTTVKVGGKLYTTISSANSSNLTSVSFNGGAAADSLKVTGTDGDLAVTLTAAESVAATTAATKNLTITSNGATALGVITVGGDLSVTPSGVVTNTGKLTVTGTTTISGGANDITLGTSTNAFTAALILSGKNVTVAAT